MADKTFVENRIESKSKPLFICSLVSVVIDVLALVLLLASGVVDLIMIIALSVLLVVGVTQCILALNSNYRFPYAKAIVIVQILLWLAFVICLVFVASAGDVIDGGKYELRYAVSVLGYWVVIRAVQITCTIATLIHASVSSKKVGSIVALVFTGVFAVSSLTFGVGFAIKGFYGQGSGNKVVVYEYDETTQTYNAKRFIGNGNSVVIPEKFNGQPVTSISYELFTLEDVTSVTINATDFVISEQAVADLTQTVKNKNITAPKAMANRLRNFLFDAGRAHHNPSLFDLGNGVRINDLKADERAIYYNYTRDENVLVGGVALPITVVNKGETFNPETLYQDVDYALNYDETDATDLIWASEYNNGYILSGFNGLEHTVVNENEVIDIEFEKVVKLNIGADNDTLYEMPTTFTQTDGSSFKLVTEDTVNGLMAQAPTRDGFNLSWNATGLSNNDFAQLVASADANAEISVRPNWSLNAPVISAVSVSNLSGSGQIIYGNDFALNQTSTAPASDFTLTYAWDKAGSSVGTGATYEKTNAYPTDAGEYTLTVTASSVNSSLTSSASKTVTVTVAPKTVNLSWSSNQNITYDANSHDITASVNDLINGDSVSVELSRNAVMDAGDYDITASIPSDWQSKYVIASQDRTCSYKVNPATLTVVWTNLNLTYNGTAQSPLPQVSPLSTDMVQVEVSQKKTNAGEYQFTAVFLPGQERSKNYVLANETVTVTIKKAQIEAVMPVGDLTYNASVQYPQAQSVTGTINESVTLKYTALTDCKTAGSHTVKVEIDDQYFANYCFAGATKSFDHDFTILAKQINDYSWTNAQLSYNGTAQYPTLNASGIGGEDLTLSYEGNGTTVGSYQVTVTMANPNYDFGVGVNSLVKDFTIIPAQIEYAWSNTVFTYDGTEQRPTLNASGFGSDDLNITYSAGAISVGNHSVTATIGNDNYLFVGGVDNVSTEFTITKAQLSYQWSSLALTYDGTEQRPTLIASGFGGDDLDITYSAGAVNAGNHSVTATLGNDNYCFSGEVNTATTNYGIAKKVITFVWEERTFVYDGTEQYPTLSVSGLIGSDDAQITYSEGAISAGKYSVTATIGNGNYCFSGGVTSVSKEFEIAKKEVTLTWTDELVPTASASESVEITYTYYEKSDLETPVELPTEAGEYVVVASVLDGNYEISETTKSREFTITQTDGE